MRVFSGKAYVCASTSEVHQASLSHPLSHSLSLTLSLASFRLSLLSLLSLVVLACERDMDSIVTMPRCYAV